MTEGEAALEGARVVVELLELDPHGTVSIDALIPTVWNVDGTIGQLEALERILPRILDLAQAANRLRELGVSRDDARRNVKANSKLLQDG